MPKIQLSTKRLQIDHTNVVIVTVVAVACFVTVFSLVGAKSLLGKLSYQNKVINLKEKAKKQLVADITARDQLTSSYKTFVGTDSNIIGGSSTGSGDRDGDNAKIVLDALPSKYDYPALATSLEKLISVNNLTITSITGTDDSLNQTGDATVAPQPVDMPFTIGFTGDKTSTAAFFNVLKQSIRPIQVQKVTITATDSRLATSITAKTYYQPERTFKVTSGAVK